MPDPDDHRRQLAAFLRAHREALAPASHPREFRRRTPGLRREEVAQRCGLSTTWYTWLEQGRDIALSATALARLADALHLTQAERAYLFELTRRRDPAPPAPAPLPETTPIALTAALHATTAPAYLLDRLWHARAWNAAAASLFAPWFDSGETNLLRYVFLHATARAFIPDWENRARRLLAEFRADTAPTPDDPALQHLVQHLRERSADFTRFWNDHAVLAREGGTRLFNDRQSCTHRYAQVTLTPTTHPNHKFVMLLPAPNP